MPLDKAVADFERLLLDAQKTGTESSMFLQVMAPPDAHAFRLCAIPHSYDAQLIQQLLPALTPEEAQKRSTAFAGLAAVTPVIDGWAIHDKWRREIFQTWLSSENRQEFEGASRRLAEFFAVRAGTADPEARQTAMRRHMYHLIGADATEGLRSFEHMCRRARQQLRYAECTALIKMVHDYDAILTVSQRTIVSYHEAKLASDTRDWATAERLLQLLVDSVNVGVVLRVKANLRLGYVLAQQGNLQAALEACQRARALAEGDATASATLPRVLHELGVTYRDLGDQEEALRLLRDSADRAAANTEWNSFAIAQNSLGGLYLKQRLAGPAIEAFRASLERLDRDQDPLRVSQVYNNIALAYIEQRDWTTAEEWFGKSLEIKRKAGDVLGQALAFNNLLRVHMAQGEFEAAVKMASQATHYFQMGGNLRGAALAQQNLAKAYRKLGKPQLARECYDDAIKLFTNAGDNNAAQALRAEVATLDVHVGLPWWAWIAVVLMGLFFALFIVLIVLMIVFGP